MSKGLRLTEKWMQRALWLVAFVFAGFLIGLGSLIVQNVRDVEEPLTIEQFMNPAQMTRVRAEMDAAHEAQQRAQSRLEQASQKHTVAASNTASARATFGNWLATRQATARPDQDPELIRRTKRSIRWPWPNARRWQRSRQSSRRYSTQPRPTSAPACVGTRWKSPLSRH